MTTSPNFEFVPFDGLKIDPRYAELRERCPVTRMTPPYGEDAWLLTRHDDIREALGDPRLSRVVPEGHDEARVAPIPLVSSFVNLDGADHARLRRLVAKPFSGRNIARLRPLVRHFAEDLLDEVEANGAPADLVSLFTVPYAGKVICELLSVPYDDRATFHNWIQAFFHRGGSPEEVPAQLAQLNDYLTRLVRERTDREHGEDLVTAMIQAAGADGSYTEEELVGLLYLLLIGGYETPGSQLGSAVFLLLQAPDQLVLLRGDPELMPSAVEELLRFVPLVAHTGFARYATEDLTIRGVTIRAGDAVLSGFGSANRDPDAFDNPDVFDITRTHNPHLSFGHGTHFCTGAALARMEMQEALAALLRRFPNLSIAGDPDALPWVPGTQIRSLEALPVQW